MITADISKKLQGARKMSYLGMAAGIVVIVLSLYVGLYALQGWRYVTAQGPRSPEAITLWREQIKQMPLSQENLQKLADGVYRRATSDSEVIRDMMLVQAQLLFSAAGLGILIFMFSLKRRQLIDLIQRETSTKE